MTDKYYNFSLNKTSNSKNRLVSLLLHNFEAESGAKVSHIFETSKFSEDFFQKLFEEPFAAPLMFERNADAKVSHIFETSKSFGKFFKFF